MPSLWLRCCGCDATSSASRSSSPARAGPTEAATHGEGGVLITVVAESHGTYGVAPGRSWARPRSSRPAANRLAAVGGNSEEKCAVNPTLSSTPCLRPFRCGLICWHALCIPIQTPSKLRAGCSAAAALRTDSSGYALPVEARPFAQLGVGGRADRFLQLGHERSVGLLPCRRRGRCGHERVQQLRQRVEMPRTGPDLILYSTIVSNSNPDPFL